MTSRTGDSSTLGDSPATKLVAHLLVAVTVIFVAVWRIGVPDAPTDEITYRICGGVYIRHGRLCNPSHPPLAKELLGVGVTLFGDTITNARLVVAVAATVTALFLYLFLRDVAGWIWGLVAAAMWGLLPQAGIDNGVSLEAIRIDRFALVDPFEACFFAAALFFGWRWLTRGGLLWPALTGAACVAAACSKVPGLFIAPVVLGAPIAVRVRGQGRRVLAEAGVAAAACVVMLVLVYAPFGAHLAVTQIRDMIRFQSRHSAAGTAAVVGHHYYPHEPWWSGLAYAVEGWSWPVAIALAFCCVAGLASRSGAAAYAAGASVCVWAFLAFGTHLSLPFYWIDWEPGVIVVAALGLRALWSRRWAWRATGVAAAAVLSVGAVTTVGAVATVTIGPYQRAARAITCTPDCSVLYVANGLTFSNYLSPRDDWQVEDVPRRDLLSNKSHKILVPMPGHTAGVRLPVYVVVDPASDLAAFSLATSVRAFEHDASALGYEEVKVSGRLLVWRLRNPGPYLRRSGAGRRG
ncbi:MAG: phospholipid carrier-dependent glycosyltransferase [Acidimicrobiales bacterium]